MGVDKGRGRGLVLDPGGRSMWGGEVAGNDNSAATARVSEATNQVFLLGRS